MHRKHAPISDRLRNPMLEMDMESRREAAATIETQDALITQLEKHNATLQHRIDQYERQKEADSIVSRFLGRSAS